MKNVQVIDGADNCSYSIYAFTDREFSLIFPQPGQDIEFIEGALERLGPEVLAETLQNVWARIIRKSDVHGINGALFYELDHKKIFYPLKREQDIVGAFSSSDQ